MLEREKEKKRAHFQLNISEADEMYVTYTWPEGGITTPTTTNQSIV